MADPLITKLRYMARQYTNGSLARGGNPGRHYLDEAADEIERLRAALAQPALKPCRSPYCECTEGECTHPGFYDARGTTPQESAPRLGITLDLAQKIARDCRATRLGEPLPDSLLNLVR